MHTFFIGLLLFDYVGKVEALHCEAETKLETADVIVLLFQRVALAVQVDKFVEECQLLARKLGAQFIV